RLYLTIVSTNESVTVDGLLSSLELKIPYAPHGVSLELCAKDRVGLLSEVTRILRENGLTVSRAGVSTIGEKGLNVFYVRDAYGNPVDTNIIEALRKEIGQSVMVNVKKVPANTKAPETSRGWARVSFFFGNLLERFLT
ncbi:ACT domain-containing protein 3, partial [Trifolium pratense]